ncbi:MAG TPA: hypothetical protein VFY11_14150 [Nocardioidaceae bacterium]|nr:hypothetical protein [Nocardioidaceae bacterium]
MTTYHRPEDRSTTYDDPGDQTQPHRFGPSGPSSYDDDHDRHDEWDDLRQGARDSQIPSEDQQRERFGGLNWGAGFFGWLITVSVAVIVTGLAAAGFIVFGMTPTTLATDAEAAPRVATVVALASLLFVLGISYYAGGYVAGRMSRFDGGRQGLGVWMIGLVMTGVAMAVGLLTGAELNLLDRVDVPPSVPSDRPGIWVAAIGAALMLGSLLAAVAGGKVGCRYHRKVDDAGYV